MDPIKPIQKVVFASNMSQEQKETFLKNKEHFTKKMQLNSQSTQTTVEQLSSSAQDNQSSVTYIA